MLWCYGLQKTGRVQCNQLAGQAIDTITLRKHKLVVLSDRCHSCHIHKIT